MNKRYDVAVIGNGPAGLSAAINAKVRNKDLIIFGTKEISDKITSAHMINNYLGMYGKTGKEMALDFKKHLEAMDINITKEKVTNIYPAGDYFSILTKEGMYESKSLILAMGVNFGIPIKGEKEFLGKGVSYCATCDAMFYRGRKAVVIGFDKEAEQEANFLSEIADKVFYVPVYKEEPCVNTNVDIIDDSVIEIKGDEKVKSLVLKNKTLEVDGVFILRECIAAENLVPGLDISDGHVKTDKLMQTNIPGCFAAGDITGKPYQYIKAAGEGNVAALSAVKYLDE